MIHTAPDAYIAVGSTIAKRYFLDIFDPDIPRYEIRDRLEDYFEYAESKTWESATNQVFPSVLYICPNDSIKKFVYREINKMKEDSPESINFFLTVLPIHHNTPISWQKVE
jgi:hypothetical protein